MKSITTSYFGEGKAYFNENRTLNFIGILGMLIFKTEDVFV